MCTPDTANKITHTSVPVHAPHVLFFISGLISAHIAMYRKCHFFAPIFLSPKHLPLSPHRAFSGQRPLASLSQSVNFRHCLYLRPCGDACTLVWLSSWCPTAPSGCRTLRGINTDPTTIRGGGKWVIQRNLALYHFFFRAELSIQLAQTRGFTSSWFKRASLQPPKINMDKPWQVKPS